MKTIASSAQADQVAKIMQSMKSVKGKENTQGQNDIFKSLYQKGKGVTFDSNGIPMLQKHVVPETEDRALL